MRTEVFSRLILSNPPAARTGRHYRLPVRLSYCEAQEREGGAGEGPAVFIARHEKAVVGRRLGPLQSLFVFFGVRRFIAALRETIGIARQSCHRGKSGDESPHSKTPKRRTDS
jgi:hypothetical protein